jgi:2-oxoisovalerate dehydrogenase E2 component (dihydrolipoyl transacylase)
MGTYAIKLPDVGEGVAEAELIEWSVAVGDIVRADDVLATVMTDKANIEIPSSVDGKVEWLGGEPGDTLAVGSVLIRLQVEGEGNVTSEDARQAGIPAEPSAAAVSSRQETPPPDASAPPRAAAPPPSSPPRSSGSVTAPSRGEAPAPARTQPSPSESSGRTALGAKPIAAPSVRKRARDAGIDLRNVPGTGPAGRITHDDLDNFAKRGPLAARPAGRMRDASVKEIKVIGLRRRIAEKMAQANASIPHITIVEEVDVDNLDDLRGELNTTYAGSRPKLTLIPFMIKAIVEAVHEQPHLNAHFDDEAGIISQFGGIHVGIATQTPNGLMVPVARHTETNSLWENATELARLAAGARDGSLPREDLMDSTITITSLGPLGAIATTPIINRPEVAIVGINKISVRPWWDGQQFVPRKMMNISCSFDHRIIDGWDAAVFVQKLKTLLEKPAMLFVGN